MRRGGARSPTASRRSRRPRCTVTLAVAPPRARAGRRSRRRSTQEFRVSRAFARARHDLAEGIRAQVIDKDRNPRWSPPTIDDGRPTPTSTRFFEAPLATATSACQPHSRRRRQHEQRSPSSASATWVGRWRPTSSRPGYDVIGFDLVPAALEAAAADGVTVAASAGGGRGVRRRRHHDAAERPHVLAAYTAR